MEKDLVHKRCMRDNARCADLLNGVVFEGEQVIQPEDLSELSELTGGGKPLDADRTLRRKEKERDVVKKLGLGINFVVIGIEGQSRTDYLMPLRNLLYEALEYESQVGQKRKEVRERTGLSEEEFLSGFGATDKLHPCVIFVMYYGREQWKGSLDLMGILDLEGIPAALQRYIYNYEMHLIDVRRMKNTDVFRTDLKQIFDFLGCAEDKEKLHRLVLQDEAYQNMDEDAYDLVVAYSRAEGALSVKKYCGEEGKVDMCKGLADLIADSKAEGKLEAIKSIMESLNMTAEQAMDVLKIPKEEREKYKV